MLNARFTLRTFEDRNDERDIILKPGETIVLGRASKSIHDVTLQPSLTNARFNCSVVSRKHAVIDFDGTGIAIADCGSLHGTAVNGKELVALDKIELHHGDVIRLGTEVQRGEETHQALYMEFQRLSDLSDVKLTTHEAGAYAYSSDVDDEVGSDSSEMAEVNSSAYTTPEQIKAVPGSQSRPIDLDVSEQPFASPSLDKAVIFVKKPLASKEEAAPARPIPESLDACSYRVPDLRKGIDYVRKEMARVTTDTEELAQRMEEDWSQDVEDHYEIPSDDDEDVQSIEDSSEVNMISDSEDDDLSEPEQEREPSLELNTATVAPPMAPMAQEMQNIKNSTATQDPVKEPSGALLTHAPARSRYDPVRNSQIEEPSWSAAPDYPACSWQQDNGYYINSPIALPDPSVLPYDAVDYYACNFMPDEPSSNTIISPPKPSEIKTRISIKDIVDSPAHVEEPLETTNRDTDPFVESADTNSGHANASAKTNKRKASEMTEYAVQDEPLAKKAVLTQDTSSTRAIARSRSYSSRRNRTSRQKVVNKIAASATQVAAGAVFGMIGTVAFLSSSYADQLIQWLS